MGDVVLLELLIARKLLPKFSAAVDVFCLIEDETLRTDTLKVIQDLRAAGLVVDYSLVPAKSDKQFKRAQELDAQHAVKLEQGGGVAKVRNLRTRQEETIPVMDLPAKLRASVSKNA